MFEDLYQKWRKEIIDNGRDLRVGGKVRFSWDFARWLDKHAAEQSMHLTGLTVAQKEEVRQMIQSALDTGSA